MATTAALDGTPRQLGTLMKAGIVLGGYLVACVAALIMVAIRNVGIDPAVAMASSGMYAFGDAVLFFAVFGFVGLVPTGLALVFLRPYRPFWLFIAAVAVVVSFTGLTALVLFIVGAGAPQPTALAAWSAFSVLRILPAPGFAAACLVAAVISPHRTPRRILLAAFSSELVVFGYAVFFWWTSLAAGR